MLEHTLYRIPVTSSRNKNWVPQLTKVPIKQRPAYTVQGPESRVQCPKSRLQRPGSIAQRPVSNVQSPASRVQRPESSVQRLRPEPRNYGMPSQTYDIMKLYYCSTNF